LPAQEVIAQDKKRLVVDAYARWRITDALRFFQTLANRDQANMRLSNSPRFFRERAHG
jgi:membrane protease subunit HflC